MLTSFLSIAKRSVVDERFDKMLPTIDSCPSKKIDVFQIHALKYDSLHC